MNQDDDDTWMDALAGRDRSSSPTTREARALRTALRARALDSTPLPLASARDTARENELVARAVREGVIEAAPRDTKRRWRTNWQLPLAASVLVVVGAGVLMRAQWPSSPPVVRGDEDGIVRLRAADPAAFKRELLAQLREAGVEATGYEALDVHGIDADLPLPLTPAVRGVLAAHGIAEPADGVLRIEIRSSE